MLMEIIKERPSFDRSIDLLEERVSKEKDSDWVVKYK